MKKESNVILTIIKNLVKGVVSLIGHLIKMVYLIIQWFNNLMAKAFMKMPRLVRVFLIYILIGSLVFTILVLTKNVNVSFM